LAGLTQDNINTPPGLKRQRSVIEEMAHSDLFNRYSSCRNMEYM